MTPEDGLSGVRSIQVTPDEAGVRLDRWFKRHFPQVSHGRLEKWLRTGQVRVDGRRAKAGVRLAAGQTVRVPPLGVDAAPDARKARVKTFRVTPADASDLKASILHEDDHVIVVNKPPGLAVQGGTGTRRHLDAMLDVLAGPGNERPRLVHRLDKDTSGVLVLARTARAAARFAEAFRTRAVRKVYWAVVVGVPRPSRGTVGLALAKRGSRGREQVAPDSTAGKRAYTHYRVVERAGRRAAWLALEPRTGRTHQLRAHCVALGTPILGDGKYGGRDAFLEGGSIARRLHLQARILVVPHPAGGELPVTAPLPEHMRATWRFFGFDEAGDADPLAGFDD